YDGASAAPVNAGAYGIVASVNDLNYTGSATSTLVIAKASATLTLGNLRQRYDGTPRVVTVTTSPPGLSGVSVTYAGSPTAPSAPGTYAVVATLLNPNYQAADAGGTLVVLADETWRLFLPWVGQ